MVGINEKIENLQDVFLHTQQLYSWRLTPEGQLIYSNCPSQQLFFSLFEISNCRQIICDHFQEQTVPIIAMDSIGLAWIAIAEHIDERLSSIYLLGPFFTVEASEIYLRKLCSRKQISQELVQELSVQLKLISTIPLATSLRFGTMMHYCVCGESIEEKYIFFTSESQGKQQAEEDWSSGSWHGTWQAEQELFHLIKEGNYEEVKNMNIGFSKGNVGTMCPDNPVRQAKDEAIVLLVLASRAAIFGGVSPEGSYNLSGYFIQRIENCDSVPLIYNCCDEIVKAYLKRVSQCRLSNAQYSPAVSGCMEYIRTHITEKIILDNMAHELGYTGYYLSKKFSKEYGCSINDYIKRQKIEYAKQLLENPLENTTDVSEKLSFSSPSYFAAAFRKETGMSPTEYKSRK